VKGNDVDVRTRCTSDSGAGVAPVGMERLSARWVVRLRRGQRMTSNAITTNKTRSSGDPLIGYFKASTMVETLCFIIPS
jgi:hypothetical protein